MRREVDDMDSLDLDSENSPESDDPEKRRSYWYRLLWDQIEIGLECSPGQYVTLTRKELNQLHTYLDGERVGQLSPNVQTVVRDMLQANRTPYKQPPEGPERTWADL